MMLLKRLIEKEKIFCMEIGLFFIFRIKLMEWIGIYIIIEIM